PKGAAASVATAAYPFSTTRNTRRRARSWRPKKASRSSPRPPPRCPRPRCQRSEQPVPMSSPEKIAQTQAENALGLLPADERVDAEELVALFQKLFSSPAEATTAERTRLLRLIEVLGRRSASAMPFAALGRALSARLSGDERSVQLLLREFDTKLQ